MTRPAEFIEISPALKNRWKFNKGVFKLLKTWYGWKIIREELYDHQVLWNTEKDWRTTFQQIYVFKVDSFRSHRVAEATLNVLNRQFGQTDCLYPETLGDVIACINGYSLDLSGIRSEVKEYLKRN